MARSLRIIPLGGLGEIGKNMLALEYMDDIVVIDAGVLFPEEDMLGIDLVIPDISYLKQNQDRVKAILITHGHEDHTGALPYVLRDLNVPVYAPRLAEGLIRVKLKEHRDLGNAQIVAIDPGQKVELGVFEVEWFRVCHSIPDAMGLAIKTPMGLVIHTGDFKIDHTPVDGMPTDLSNLSRISSDGVLLLMSDSTYAEVAGYTPSEQVVGEALDRAISSSPGRVLVATFASLISRIQLVIDAAERHGRKVSFTGRSMVGNINMALEMGYLRAEPHTVKNLKEINELPPEQVVIMTTGSQGEPTSALVRIANNAHRDINIEEGDTVVISATPIPGNETVVSKTIDNLLRQGARVLHDKVALVHVHGHASQEELKLMLNLIRPEFFVPVHGEHRHLKAHATLAHQVGIPKDNTFVMEDGDVLEISPESAGIKDKVVAGHVYVDGSRIFYVDREVINERKSLSGDGVVFISLIVDKMTGEHRNIPEVISYGFVNPADQSDIATDITAILLDYRNKDHASWNSKEKSLNASARETVANLLLKKTGRRPVIFVSVEEV